jgi:hypothetical protein
MRPAADGPQLVPFMIGRARSFQSALQRMNTDAIAKMAGAMGYPQALNGRGASGSRYRSTNTAATAIPANSVIANPTYVVSLSRLPVRIRMVAHMACATTEAAGVLKRGCTRAAAWKNTPSRAIA